MFRRSIIQLLCVALACMPLYPVHADAPPMPGPVDVQALHALYPHATVIRVSPEDYPELERNLRRAGYQAQSGAQPVLLAANAPDPASPSPAPPPAPVPAPQQQAPASSVDCNQRAASSGNDGDGGNVNVNVDIRTAGGSGGRGPAGRSSGRGSGGGGSGDGAIVVLVIIGAIVLVVWTIYAITYLVDMARGVTVPCSRRWSEWAVSSTGIESYRPQYANFTGVRYLTGVDHAGLNFGLSAELGQADVLLASASTLRMQGLYWMVGPLLRWGLSGGNNPSYLQMELLAGSTENKEMGLIASAKLGLNFGLGDRVRLGISYGAMNMNLHEQGIILDRSQSYTLWGVDMGFRF